MICMDSICIYIMCIILGRYRVYCLIPYWCELVTGYYYLSSCFTFNLFRSWKSLISSLKTCWKLWYEKVIFFKFCVFTNTATIPFFLLCFPSFFALFTGSRECTSLTNTTICWASLTSGGWVWPNVYVWVSNCTTELITFIFKFHTP